MKWADGKVAPNQDVYGNLHFSPAGVFAYWIVTPPDKPLANMTTAAAAAEAHRQLTDMLPRRPGFACTSSLKDARFIFEQQMRGVDAARFPLAEQIAIGRQMQAEAAQPRFPVFWMWVRLEPGGSRVAPWKALQRRMIRSGFLAPKPTRETIDEYWQEMLAVEREIPAAFAPLRPTSPQIRWLWRRQQTIGAVDEPLLLPQYSDDAVLGHRWQAQVDLHEDDFEGMVKVTAYDDGRTESFQIHAVVSSMPHGGIYFPSSNFTALISDLYDSSGNRVAVDWMQRAHSLPLSKANRRQDKTYRRLNEQYGQQSGRRSTQDLDQTEDALSGFQEEFTSYPREAEVIYTTYFTVGAPTPQEAADGYKQLRETLEGLRVELARPAGQQRRLYRAIRPGLEDLSVESSFAQYTSRTGWSRHIPLSAPRFGDAEGRAIGYNKMSGDLDFVFLNTRGDARRVSSGGMIIGGDPRKGKTHFEMLNAAEEAVSGACVAVFDATHGRQWREFVRVVPGSGVINLADGQFTADLLVLLGDKESAEMMAGELARIGGEAPNGDVGSELRLLMTGRAWSSTAEVLEFLCSPQCPPVLAPLGRRLLSWAGTRTGEALFGRVDATTGRRQPLPALRLDEVSLLVIETQSLDLPTEQEVTDARSGGEPLTAQQLISQSVMALFAVYLRGVFYRRKTRDILAFDEGWRTVSVKVLKDLVFEILRTGPAANVDVWVVSQKPWRDFPDLDEDLARVRVMFGVEDAEEAKLASRWMGIDPDRYDSVPTTLNQLSPRQSARDPFHRSSDAPTIARNRMGECLIRMGDGGFGWIKTFEMVFPEWEKAADTRPDAT